MRDDDDTHKDDSYSTHKNKITVVESELISSILVFSKDEYLYIMETFYILQIFDLLFVDHIVQLTKIFQ